MASSDVNTIFSFDIEVLEEFQQHPFPLARKLSYPAIFSYVPNKGKSVPCMQYMQCFDEIEGNNDYAGQQHCKLQKS